MDTKSLIEITIQGENIEPGTVGSKVLSSLLVKTEDLIFSVMQQDYPHIEPGTVYLGLVRVAAGSMRTQLLPSNNLMYHAYRVVGNSIQNNQYSNLPLISIKFIRSLQKLAKSNQLAFDFAIVNGSREVIATIDKDTLIEDIPLFFAPTTIYGNVVRVGGNRPKVLIELPTGKGISCSISGSLELQRQIAQDIGKRLYSWVSLEGEAGWSEIDLSLKEFKISSLGLFKDTPIDDAIKGLRELDAKYFDRIDVDKYITEIRGE